MHWVWFKLIPFRSWLGLHVLWSGSMSFFKNISVVDKFFLDCISFGKLIRFQQLFIMFGSELVLALSCSGYMIEYWLIS